MFAWTLGTKRLVVKLEEGRLSRSRLDAVVNGMATALFRNGALVDGMVASLIPVQPIVFKEPPTGLVLCARFNMASIGDSSDAGRAAGRGRRPSASGRGENAVRVGR